MKRWLLIIGGLILVGVVLASFYQPPMRLMPTPAAFVQAGSEAFAANPALVRDNRIEIFYATNRLPVGPRDNRLYAVVPGRDLLLGVASVGIGEPDKGWAWLYDLSTRAAAPEDGRRPWLPLQRLQEIGAIAEDELPLSAAELTPGTRAWLALVNAALAASPDQDIVIYVHGANSTVERAAGQAAQLRHFTGHNAVVVLFAWPTAENFLRYSKDMVTAFGAAPQLAKLVGLLAAHSDARQIDILTYSAGATVGSDGLARVGRVAGRPGVPAGRLGEIYHAAPDADFRGFVDDLRDHAAIAKRVTVAANMGDAALRLSRAMNRASRAGRPDMAELSPGATRFLLDANRELGLEIVRVRPEHIPGLSPRSHSFWYNDPWVSSDVLLTLMFHMPPADRGLVAAETADGLTVWQFAPDHDARLPGVVAAARAQARAAISGGSARAPESAASAP